LVLCIDGGVLEQLECRCWGGGEIGGDVRKIQWFREWRRGVLDAGRFGPGMGCGEGPAKERRE